MSIPAGWFVVGYSSELPPRGATQLRYFGEPLLMFRGVDGTPSVIGADHRFFDGIPYNRKVPHTAVRNWRACERNGLVLVHFHPTGQAPTWDFPSLSEYNSPDWTPYVTRRWTMESEVRGLAERADVRVRTRALIDTPFGGVPGTLDIQSLGAGVSLVRFTGAVETLLITTVTPFDDRHVDARFTFTMKRLADAATTRAIEQRFVAALETEVERDRRMHQSVAMTHRQLSFGGAPALRDWA
jgi:hypothetical protein